MKKISTTALCLLLFVKVGWSQVIVTPSQPCPVVGAPPTFCTTPPIPQKHDPVTNACELWEMILFTNQAGTGGGRTNVINLDPNAIIDLGQIPPENFPLVLEKGTLIKGGYDMFTNPNGTLLIFPYLFKEGHTCASNPFSGGQDDFTKTADSYDDDGNLLPDAMMTPVTTQFIFKLMDDAAIENIRLKGPKGYFGDYRTSLLDETCSGGKIAVRDGLANGIGIYGNNCRVENCEIYAFPEFGIERVPDLTSKGNCTIKQNYIHNCKEPGLGYGIYTAGHDTWAGDLDANNCIGGAVPNKKNFCTGDENIYITSCIFNDDATHVDGSGDRSSCYISDNTFGSRFSNKAINRHAYGNHNSKKFWTCNYSYPAPAGSLNYFQDIGGNITSITRNYFHSSSVTINTTYPNCNDISSTCSNVYAETGLLRLWDNRFYDPNGNAGSTGQVQVSGYNFLDFNDFQDGHIDFGGITGHPNIFESTLTHVPTATITSNDCAGETVISGNKIEIQVGGKAKFYPTSSLNANLGMGTDMKYHWRFHETAFDYDDVIVTDWYPYDGALLCHQFNNIGITNVNMMAFDPKTYTASNFATKKVTVRPVDGDKSIYLVANIMDTYAPRNLSQHWNCKYLADIREDVDHTPTGFRKFISITQAGGTPLEIWSEDIADDCGGWERVEITLDPKWLCSVNSTSCRDLLQIGIKAVSGGVDAEIVRGVILFVDDVYINTPDGKNAIGNGDFEAAFNASSDWITITPDPGINEFGNHPLPALTCTLPNVPSGGSVNLNLLATGRSDYEVRSGNFSFKGYIKKYLSLKDTQTPIHYPHSYYAGLRYPEGIYTGVQQEFNVQNAGTPRLMDPNNFDFTLHPNPSAEGTIVNGNIPKYESSKKYALTIYSPQGNLIYSGIANQNFTIQHSFAPGVYYVKMTDGTSEGFKKLVVTR